MYEAVTSINNAHSTDTKKVLSVTPTTGGRQVTMSDTVIPGSATVTQNYIFYDNGQIGFPISQSHGISVVSGNGIVWPDAADLAAGQASHSTSKIKLTSGQLETADVTVQGGGTQPVTVPAGTYQATLVNMTIVTHVGSFTTTIDDQGVDRAGHRAGQVRGDHQGGGPEPGHHDRGAALLQGKG